MSAIAKVAPTDDVLADCDALTRIGDRLSEAARQREDDHAERSVVADRLFRSPLVQSMLARGAKSQRIGDLYTVYAGYEAYRIDSTCGALIAYCVCPVDDVHVIEWGRRPWVRVERVAERHPTPVETQS